VSVSELKPMKVLHGDLGGGAGEVAVSVSELKPMKGLDRG
jgi:hypothetical protein